MAWSYGNDSTVVLDQLCYLVALPKLLAIVVLTQKGKVCQDGSQSVALLPVMQPFLVVVVVDCELGAAMWQVRSFPGHLLFDGDSSMPLVGSNGGWFGLHISEDASLYRHSPYVQKLLVIVAVECLLELRLLAGELCVHVVMELCETLFLLLLCEVAPPNALAIGWCVVCCLCVLRIRLFNPMPEGAVVIPGMAKSMEGVLCGV